MSLKIFFLSFLFIAAVLSTQTRQCFQDIKLGTHETQVIKLIKDALSMQEKFEIDCMDSLIDAGYYKAAIVLFEDYFMMNNVEISESGISAARTKKRDLDRLLANLWSTNQAVQQIEPIIKWAQSNDNVFLSLKMSLRQDSPACIHCKIEKVEITNTTLFTSSFGIQSHQPLRFLLNLTLFDEVDPELSTWKEDSVGTLFFNLTKVKKVIESLNTQTDNSLLNAENTPNNINETAEQQQIVEDPNLSNEDISIQASNSENIQEQTLPNTNEEQQQASSTDANQPDNSNVLSVDKVDSSPQENNVEAVSQAESNGLQTDQASNNSQNEDNGETTTQAQEGESIIKAEDNKQDSTEQKNSETTSKQEEDSPKTENKLPKNIWLHLEKEERKKDFSVWWDMRDRYKEDMEEWDKLRAQEKEKKKRQKGSQQQQQNIKEDL